MPPAQDDDDRNARQIEALKRYVADLGTNREQRPEGETVHKEHDEEEPDGRRRSPLLPWLVLTALLVAAALIGGVLIGAARENGQEAGAAGRSGSAAQATSTLVAPVATPECKTAVDRANRSLAAAVKVRGVLDEYTKIMDDLRNGRIDARQAAARISPYLALGTAESDKFEGELAEYEKVVDKCKLREP
jgi:hypothetical protein